MIYNIIIFLKKYLHMYDVDVISNSHYWEIIVCIETLLACFYFWKTN